MLAQQALPFVAKPQVRRAKRRPRRQARALEPRGSSDQVALPLGGAVSPEGARALENGAPHGLQPSCGRGLEGAEEIEKVVETDETYETYRKIEEIK